MSDISSTAFVALWLVGVIAFVAGFFAGGILGSGAFERISADIESRGVWTFKDRAYKLTPIAKDKP